MGDIDSIAHIRQAIARLRMQRGEYRSGGLQQIHDDLAEAFAISRQFGRPDAIGAVGELLAQVLAMAGDCEQELQVLALAEEAFATIGDRDGVQRVRALRLEIAGH